MPLQGGLYGVNLLKPLHFVREQTGKIRMVVIRFRFGPFLF
jgi:hypothetical protein